MGELPMAETGSHLPTRLSIRLVGNRTDCPKRAKARHIRFALSNHNAYTTLRFKLLPGIRASIVLSQELRLRANEIPAAKAHMAKLGWKLFAAPCLSGPGGGPSAGVAILCRSFLDMSPNLTNGPMVLVEGRVIVVPMRTAGLGIVYVYSVYLISGIALSDANITILKAVVDHIVSHGAPYVVGADWQNGPDVIRSALAPLGLVGATVFAPDVPTYTHTLAESTIDYYIVDSRIGMNVSELACPPGSLVSPHSPVFLSLGLNGHDVVVSSVVKPPIFP